MPKIKHTSTYQGEPVRFVNRTGGVVGGESFPLVSISGFDIPTKTIKANRARANGSNKLAVLIVPDPIADGRTATGYKALLAENQNTAGTAVGDAVYLDPTTAGTYTFTAPKDDGEDTQAVGEVLTVDAVEGRILFNLEGVTSSNSSTSNGGSDSINANELQQKPVHNPGNGGIGYLRFVSAGTVNAGDKVTIDGRVFEWTNGAVSPGTDVGMPIGGATTTVALAAAALTTAINTTDAAFTGLNILAVNDTVGTQAIVTLFGKDNDGTNRVVTIGTNAGGGMNNKQNLTGGEDKHIIRRIAGEHVFTASDVAKLALTLGTSAIPIAVANTADTTYTPMLISFQGYLALGGTKWSPQTLDGAVVDLRGAGSTIAELYYSEPAGGALFAAGDKVTYAIEYHKQA